MEDFDAREVVATLVRGGMLPESIVAMAETGIDASAERADIETCERWVAIEREARRLFEQAKTVSERIAMLSDPAYRDAIRSAVEH